MFPFTFNPQVKVSNFNIMYYYSYSYDLSHTLQYNLSPPKEIRPTFEGVPMDGELHERGKNVVLGVKAHPNYKFVWNSYLLKPVESVFHPDWILFVIHGFVGQSNISLYGKSLYLTLIARRSNKFAGTRFLKRGANYEVIFFQSVFIDILNSSTFTEGRCGKRSRDGANGP